MKAHSIVLVLVASAVVSGMMVLPRAVPGVALRGNSGVTLRGNSGTVLNTNSIDGKKLAAMYCSSCHVLPEPDHLDKSTWIKKIFPVMRTFMGLDTVADRESMAHDVAALYPTTPTMTEDQWFQIAEYYIDEASSTMPIVPLPTVDSTTNPFSTMRIKLGITPPMTTLVKFDTAGKRIVIGDGTKNEVYVCDLKGKVLHTFPLSGPPSAVAFAGNKWYITNLGKLLPHDSAIGSITMIDWSSGSPIQSTPITTLRRPSHVAVADLNSDKIPDLIVCEYGNLVGRLGWFEGTKSGKFKYHELLSQPGAIRTYCVDINADGKLDIVVQMAQAREGIYAFVNSGKGLFQSRELIVLPPSFGSSWFGFTDWNGDKYPDIVLTTGDNGDYADPPFKPYHGCYVYTGGKNMQFQKQEFYPMYGAYGAHFGSFDNTRRKNLFLFSYFPNLDQGLAGLIRLYPDVGNQSLIQTIRDAQLGRWLTFDVADIDNDGKMEVILGNVSHGPVDMPDFLMQIWTRDAVSAIVLKSSD